MKQVTDMSSDRFGEIKIKPDAEEISSDNHERKTPARQRKTGFFKKKDRASKPGSSKDHGISKKYPPGKHLPFVPGWLLLCFAIPLFLALLYGVGSYFLVPSLVKGPLAKNLAANLGRPVTVNRVIFSPFTLDILLRDVTVGPVYGDLNKNNLLDFPEISCQVDFGALLQRKLICHEVKLDGFTANLIRLRLGSLSIDDATNFFSLIRGRSGQNLWPEWLAVDGVELTNGKITINDSLTNTQHHIENLIFYLPSSEEAIENPEAMPGLKAIVNSSPVEMKGTRRKNLQGVMETRFNLKFSEIVLKNYLEYIPSLPQNPFRLQEGQADLDIELVIPELSGDRNKVKVQLNAEIKALLFSDGNGRPILKIPETSLLVNAFPARNSYAFKKVEFNRPVFTARIDGENDKNQQGVYLNELNNFFRGLDKYPYGLRIENFFINEGMVEILRGKNKLPLYTFEKGQVRLNGFLNEVAREEEAVPNTPAAFWVSCRDKENHDALLKADGKYNVAEKINGSFIFNKLDVKKYEPLLPVRLGFSKGEVDISGKYEYFSSSAGKDENHGRVQWQVAEGKFTIRDFVLQRNGKNILDGSRAVCQNFQADSSTATASCDTLVLEKNTIDGNAIPLSTLTEKKTNREGWIFTSQNINIQNSQLTVSVMNPFEQDQGVPLHLKNVSLQAENIQSTDALKAPFAMSAVLGSTGQLLLDGTYSIPAGKGELRVTLQEISLSQIKDFISPWFAPQIQNGIISIDGTYAVGEKRFSGNVRMGDFRSGDTEGLSLALQEASFENLQLTLKPLVLKSGEVMIDGPRISFGITHPEKPLLSFLQPAFEKKLSASVDINSLRFTNGSFAMPEPVVVKGFQPQLEELNGMITGIGRDVMDFSLQGELTDQGIFSIQGKTGLDSLKHYSLEVNKVALQPFVSVFAEHMGVDVSEAIGSWQVEMMRTDSVIQLNSRVEMQGVIPDPQSRYFDIISLYTGENNTIVFEGQSEFSLTDETVFLFDRLFRGMQQDGVRAELSKQLVLNKMLPALTLQREISFIPGTTTLLVNKDLAHYEKLLAKRPYLRLGLIGNYDPVRDKLVMKKRLQDAADAEREAENKRRAEERQKIVEQEKARLEELKKEQEKVIEEEIPPFELRQDLQPLPYREVEVQQEMLIDLAQKRAAALYRFFIDGLLIAPERIYMSPQTGDSGPEVRVEVLPYKAGLSTQGEVSGNDQTAH